MCTFSSGGWKEGGASAGNTPKVLLFRKRFRKVKFALVH